MWFGAAAKHCAIYGVLGDHKDELKDYDISIEAIETDVHSLLD